MRLHFIFSIFYTTVHVVFGAVCYNRDPTQNVPLAQCDEGTWCCSEKLDVTLEARFGKAATTTSLSSSSITDVSSMTSKLSQTTSSTESSQPSSTGKNGQPSSSPKTLSKNAKIGIGIGVGLLVVTFISYSVFRYRRNSRGWDRSSNSSAGDWTDTLLLLSVLSMD